MNLINIKIADIKEDEDRRPLGDLTALKESILEVGLLNPVTATGTQGEYRLVAGLHRLRACEQLGWTEIPAMVRELDELKSELAGIDENLVRNQLTKLEVSEQLLRRKEIYEAIHSGSTAGEHRAHGMNQKLGNNVGENCAPTFVEDTASKTGMSKRTVQKKVSIAENIDPAVKDAARNTPIANNQSQLDRIAKLEPEQQAKEVERLKKAAEPRVKDTAAATESEAVPALRFSTVVADLESLSELSARPIKGASKPNSVLWLWATNAQLQRAFEITNDLGFCLRTVLTWVQGPGLDHGIHESIKHCLVFVRGAAEITVSDQGLALIAPVDDDARKPTAFYELVDRLCRGSKIELGVPAQREGWGPGPISIAPIEPQEGNQDSSNGEDEQECGEGEDEEDESTVESTTESTQETAPPTLAEPAAESKMEPAAAVKSSTQEQTGDPTPAAERDLDAAIRAKISQLLPGAQVDLANAFSRFKNTPPVWKQFSKAEKDRLKDLSKHKSGRSVA